MEETVKWAGDNIWMILFFIRSFPLGYFRSLFRKKVYGTDSWAINIKPVFLKELKALFSDIYPSDREYLRLRNFYRFYLSVYMLLLFFWTSGT